MFLAAARVRGANRGALGGQVDSINAEAVAALRASLLGLLPTTAPTPALTVMPLGFRPTGLGGFVELQQDPPGEVIGRLVDAEAHVRVRAADAAALDTAVADTIGSITGAGRGTLRQLGLLRVEVGDIGAPPKASEPVERLLKIQVRFEYLKRPEDGEGVIQTIPITVTNKLES